MSRGSNSQVEVERMRRMEQGPTLKEREKGSGSVHFEKAGYGRVRSRKAPASARKR